MGAQLTRTLCMAVFWSGYTSREGNMKKASVPSSFKAIPALMFKNLARTNSSKNLLPEEDLEYLEKNTNADRAQIQEQYQAFLLNHPDGKISMKAFCSMIGEGSPGTNTSKLSKHIWRIYDTNMDGFIDFREFMMALQVMSSGSSEDNLKQLFKVFDINSDGTIDVEEMNENEDGKISQEEFTQACLRRKKSSTALALK